MKNGIEEFMEADKLIQKLIGGVLITIPLAILVYYASTAISKIFNVCISPLELASLFILGDLFAYIATLNFKKDNVIVIENKIEEEMEDELGGVEDYNRSYS